MISVIVPVYNVEPYLEKCLDSILAQSYHNIEIILINDGSTDRSRAICEVYQKKDKRIRFFDNENHGLAATRNFGVEHAHGDWIMFVDSDDWVDPDFCKIPYSVAIENNADMVIFELLIVEKDGRLKDERKIVTGFSNSQIAVEYGRNAAWNKLYKRELFDTIRYPEGRLFEDIATTYKLVYKAKRIVMLDTPLYYYRRREGSISFGKKYHMTREWYISIVQRYNGLLCLGYQVEKLELEMLNDSLYYLMFVEPSEDPVYRHAVEIVNSLDKLAEKLSATCRNYLKIWKMNQTLFHTLCRERKIKAQK